MRVRHRGTVYLATTYVVAAAVLLAVVAHVPGAWGSRDLVPLLLIGVPWVLVSPVATLTSTGFAFTATELPLLGLAVAAPRAPLALLGVLGLAAGLLQRGVTGQDRHWTRLVLMGQICVEAIVIGATVRLVPLPGAAGHAVAGFAAFLAYYGVNTVLTAVSLRFHRGVRHPLRHSLDSFRQVRGSGATFACDAVTVFLGAASHATGVLLIAVWPGLLISCWLSIVAFERHVERARARTQAFVDALAERDEYSAEHTVRAARYAEEIARELDMSPVQLDRVWLATVLHDSGKVRVPLEILRKPGPLTRAEAEVMARHELDTVVMLRDDPDLRGVAHLAGRPLWARDADHRRVAHQVRLIVCLADAYDAMTTDRPYRAAMSHEEAIIEIKTHPEQFWDEAVEGLLGALRRLEGPIPSKSHFPDAPNVGPLPPLTIPGPDNTARGTRRQLIARHTAA